MNIKDRQICFVLPQFYNHPSGGYKVVFEYANRFAKDNINVVILFLNDNALSRFYIPKKIKEVIMNVRTNLGPKWFSLDKKVKCYSSTQSNLLKKLRHVTDVIATDATTVKYVVNSFHNANKFYFIQGFENWNMDLEELYETYNCGLKNIVISKSLKKIVDEHSSYKAFYIRNGIDIGKYCVHIPVNNRNKYLIGMLYSDSKVKGSEYVIQALKRVKQSYPKLEVIMFGTSKLTTKLPKWFTYVKDATQKETIQIYNKINIFVSGSINEGFGLTGLEAMACCAALVTTDYPAVHEYAINNINSIIVPTKDTKMMAHAIIRLIDNSTLHTRLTTNGVKDARGFAWDVSYKKMKKIILN